MQQHSIAPIAFLQEFMEKIFQAIQLSGFALLPCGMPAKMKD
jgi:hypothetical protein